MNILVDLRKLVRTGLVEKTEVRTIILPSAVMDLFRADVKQREADGLPPRSEDDLLELWIVDHALAEHQGGLPHEIYPFPKRGSATRGIASKDRT